MKKHWQDLGYNAEELDINNEGWVVGYYYNPLKCELIHENKEMINDSRLDIVTDELQCVKKYRPVTLREDYLVRVYEGLNGLDIWNHILFFIYNSKGVVKNELDIITENERVYLKISENKFIEILKDEKQLGKTYIKG